MQDKVEPPDYEEDDMFERDDTLFDVEDKD
jgi:hypothetical protein